MKPRRCFVIMPFGEPFDRYYRNIFVPAIVQAGLEPVRADSISRPSEITQDIWRNVQDATVLVADLTGRNTNVAYEVGLAHAVGQPVILVADEIGNVPFDLRSLRILLYDKNNEQWGYDLRNRLLSSLRETLADRAAAIPPIFRQAGTPSSLESEPLGDSNSDVRLREVLEMLGNRSSEVAAAAARDFASLWYSERQRVMAAFDGLLSAPVEQLPYPWLPPDCRPEIRAYRNFMESVRPEQAIAWLKQPGAEFVSLVDTPARHVAAALVDVGPILFTACWLQLNAENHIIIMNKELLGEERIETLHHELCHLVDYLCTQTEEHGTHGKRSIRRFQYFAAAQRQNCPEEKTIMARWAVQEMRIISGAGVFLDAGSSCLAVWQEIIRQLELQRFSHLSVVTNNFMVLQDWVNSASTIPEFQGTSVDLAGEIFDTPHLAFYGEATRRRLMSGSFLPSVVYIGTSGIDFYESSKIFLGFHAGELERASKELLFQCPSKARVILADSRKIGQAGGNVFDCLTVDHLDARAPIYLVTVEPSKGSPDQRTFESAYDAFLSSRMQTAIANSGVQFHWVVLSREDAEVPRALRMLSSQIRGPT